MLFLLHAKAYGQIKVNSRKINLLRLNGRYSWWDESIFSGRCGPIWGPLDKIFKIYSVLLVMGSSSVTLDKYIKVSDTLPVYNILHYSIVVMMSRAAAYQLVSTVPRTFQITSRSYSTQQCFLQSKMQKEGSN